MANGFNPYERRLLAATMGFGAQQPQQPPQLSQEQQLSLQRQPAQGPQALLPQSNFNANVPGNPTQLPTSIAELMGSLPGMITGFGGANSQQQPAGPTTPSGLSSALQGYGASLSPARAVRGEQLADQVNTLLASQANFRTPSSRDIQLAQRDSLSAQRNLRAMRGPRTRPTVSQRFDALQAAYDPSGRRISGVDDQSRVGITRRDSQLNAEFFRRSLANLEQESQASRGRYGTARQESIDRFNSPETQALKRRVLDRVARRRAAGDLKTATPAMLRRRVEVRARRKSELAQRRANVTARAAGRRGMVSMSPAAQMQRMMQTNPELIFQLAQLNQQGQQFRDTSQFRTDELTQRGQQFTGTREDVASALRAQIQGAEREDATTRLFGGQRNELELARLKMEIEQGRLAQLGPDQKMADLVAQLTPGAAGAAGAADAADVQPNYWEEKTGVNPWPWLLAAAFPPYAGYKAATSKYGPWPGKVDKRDPVTGALLPPIARPPARPDLNAMDVLMGTGGLSR